jgi:mannose-6-phosphate isomerase-like protein (cupin superfamily)
MTVSRQGAFDLSDTYLHLGAAGDALQIAGGDAFWQALMSGDRSDPAIARVTDEPGYLIGGFRMTDDTAHWEMHPEGDEIIHLLSGAVNFVLEEPGGKRTIKLRNRGCCLVPRGVWHRVLVRRTSEVVFITFGRGTQHRAVDT